MRSRIIRLLAGIGILIGIFASPASAQYLHVENAGAVCGQWTRGGAGNALAANGFSYEQRWVQDSRRASSVEVRVAVFHEGFPGSPVLRADGYYIYATSRYDCTVRGTDTNATPVSITDYGFGWRTLQAVY